jgi:hypothetical protein
MLIYAPFVLNFSAPFFGFLGIESPILFGDPCFAPPPSDATTPGGTRNP